MNTIRLIETYLDKNLEGKELENFLERLENDTDFKAEVDLHREINESIIDDSPELRMKIRNLIPDKKHSITRTIAIISALAAIFIIGFTIFPIANQQSADKAFQIFYTPYETDLTTRSNETSGGDFLKYACISYQNKDYSTSYDIIKGHIKIGDNNYAALFYFGLSALELNKFQEAENSLTAVYNSNSNYSIHACWYLGMLYLKTNNLEKAQYYLEPLSNSKNFYSRNAKNIIQKYL